MQKNLKSVLKTKMAGRSPSVFIDQEEGRFTYNNFKKCYIIKIDDNHYMFFMSGVGEVHFFIHGLATYCVVFIDLQWIVGISQIERFMDAKVVSSGMSIMAPGDKEDIVIGMRNALKRACALVDGNRTSSLRNVYLPMVDKLFRKHVIEKEIKFISKAKERLEKEGLHLVGTDLARKAKDMMKLEDYLGCVVDHLSPKKPVQEPVPTSEKKFDLDDILNLNYIAIREPDRCVTFDPERSLGEDELLALFYQRVNNIRNAKHALHESEKCLNSEYLEGCQKLLSEIQQRVKEREGK